MATKRPAAAVDDTAPSQAPQSTPQTGGLPGGIDYTSFIWQQLNEIQGTLGGLRQAIDTQSRAIGKVEDRVGQLGEKIHSINIKIAAAAAVVSLVILVGGFVLKEVWDVAKPIVVQSIAAGASKPAPK